ncbi:MAG: phosphoribosylglycinamide formyltransferase, partial [Planctomycetaceae bacterium]|nr:phosphoribosylglycinamide formyltransferase [Planctomycetaceae bacterium]
MRLPTPLRMAALISGGGRTVLNLLDWIDAGRLPGSMQLVLANKDCAGVERIRERGVPVDVLRASDFGGTAARDAELFDRLRAAQVDVVLLAGYLARIEIPSDFEHRVINIHPSLIPAFCGQGMFGDNVHAAVIQRGCKVTGCTVHFCDNEYDHGPIIAQRVVP